MGMFNNPFHLGTAMTALRIRREEQKKLAERGVRKIAKSTVGSIFGWLYYRWFTSNRTLRDSDFLAGQGKKLGGNDEKAGRK